MIKTSLPPFWKNSIRKSGWLTAKHQACLLLHRSQSSFVSEFLIQHALCHEATDDPCGHCRSCLAFVRGEHPDLVTIAPATTKTIGVQQVRDALTEVGVSATLGSLKVFWVTPLDAMTQAANNALLKTLEEPPSNCLFILSARLSVNILPTIKSRVFSIELLDPTSEQLCQDYQNHLSQVQCEQLDHHLDTLFQCIDCPSTIDEYLEVKESVSGVAMGKQFAVGLSEKLMKLNVDPLVIIQAWLRDTYRALSGLQPQFSWPYFYHGSIRSKTAALLEFDRVLSEYLVGREKNTSFNHVLMLDTLLLGLRQLTKELTA